MLHIIKYSPFSHPALKQCIQSLQPDDQLLFIEDGVLIAQEGNELAPMLSALKAQSIHLYALEADLQARHIRLTQPSIKSVNFDGFVTLCEHNPQIVTW